MIPTEEALADMAAIRCEQDEGEHPLAWFEPGEFGPEGAWRGLAGVRTAELPSGGLPEPDAETAQTGAHRHGVGNGGA